MTNFTDWNHHLARDYDWFTDFWKNEISEKFKGSDYKCKNTKYNWSNEKINNASLELGQIIKKELKLNITDLNSEQSAFFKFVYENIDYGKEKI
jgi:hypothetical protein